MTLFIALYLQDDWGDEQSRKNNGQDEHGACRILHKVFASDWNSSVCKDVKAPKEYPFLKHPPDMEADKETEIWYAMRATYRREPDAMRLLEKEKNGLFRSHAIQDQHKER